MIFNKLGVNRKNPLNFLHNPLFPERKFIGICVSHASIYITASYNLYLAFGGKIMSITSQNNAKNH